jgi:hypothetical protein
LEAWLVLGKPMILLFELRLRQQFLAPSPALASGLRVDAEGETVWY